MTSNLPRSEIFENLLVTSFLLPVRHKSLHPTALSTESSASLSIKNRAEHSGLCR
jgi:hypothetical protein